MNSLRGKLNNSGEEGHGKSRNPSNGMFNLFTSWQEGPTNISHRVFWSTPRTPWRLGKPEITTSEPWEAQTGTCLFEPLSLVTGLNTLLWQLNRSRKKRRSRVTLLLEMAWAGILNLTRKSRIQYVSLSNVQLIFPMSTFREEYFSLKPRTPCQNLKTLGY